MKLTAAAVADWAGRQGADQSIDFATYYAASQSLGRPSKLSPALIDELIAEYRLAPISRDAVCDKIGISDQTRRNWCKHGELDYEHGLNTLEAQFFGVFKRARGYWQGQLLVLALQGTQQWACYVTLLERIFPSEFGRRVDDASAPRVVVQIGVQTSDVQVQIGTPPVNVIANYQTHSQSEGVMAQAVAALQPSPFATETDQRNTAPPGESLPPPAGGSRRANAPEGPHRGQGRLRAARGRRAKSSVAGDVG